MLRKRREELNLTQQQVAEKAGMPLRTYQSYELGVRIPNVIYAMKIAEVLNSQVHELFKY
jgi:transcriptional regulator with XRE-family HTH domain